MSERSVFLGAEDHILGILTEPTERRETAPVALLLNAGLIHRVGPNRLNVDIARRLAAHGYTALRFDMSGIGDSDRPQTQREYVEQSIQDIVTVMDSCEAQLGADKFVLIGLCTGAYNALAAASEDERVTGAVLIDGYAYPTVRYEISNWSRKLFQLWRWKRYLRRRLGLSPTTASEQPDELLVFQPEDLSRDEFGRRLAALARRGTRVQLAYTGNGPQPYNYRGQLADAFPQLDKGNIRETFLPDANHTFTMSEHRQEMVDAVATWMDDSFGMERTAQR